MKIVSACEHYELLIDEGHDPMLDPPPLQAYMSRWDGHVFFEAADVENKSVLDVGIGTGRVAASILESGCRCLTGVDFSPKSLARAKLHLQSYPNVELIQADIHEFTRPNTFDIAYSVLTFLHMEDKEKALRNIHLSLKDQGAFVLSVSRDEEWLVYGSRKIQLYPLKVDEYICLFHSIGFHIESVKETESSFATIMKGIKTGIQGR